MARARQHPTTTRFSDAEIEALDRMRGPITRSQFVRLLLHQEQKRRGIPTPNTH